MISKINLPFIGHTLLGGHDFMKNVVYQFYLHLKRLLHINCIGILIDREPEGKVVANVWWESEL